MIKRCRCNNRGTCGFDPTTCLNCGGRIVKSLRMIRNFINKKQEEGKDGGKNN